MMKALVAGWFSFEQMGATAGDLLTRDLVCEWLAGIGRSFDVALAHPFQGGVDWKAADPAHYSHVIFVCGPFGNGWPLTEFLPRFSRCRLIGVNLSMIEPLEVWNPFDLLLERDSSAAARPDLSFLSRRPSVPVVGVALVHPQQEYKEDAMHDVANAAIRQLVDSREMSAVPIDTRLDVNSGGLRTHAEVESLIAKMDVLLTTRLHGTVLALKNGVPVVAVDPIAGGAKIRRQTETIGWPVSFTADAVTADALQRGFDYCLTEDAREKARECSERSKNRLLEVRNRFLSAMADP